MLSGQITKVQAEDALDQVMQDVGKLLPQHLERNLRNMTGFTYEQRQLLNYLINDELRMQNHLTIEVKDIVKLIEDAGLEAR
jgi:hypothetical protein